MKILSIQDIKVKNFIKTVIVALILGIAAQVYINILITDFKISFAIILFPIFLFLHKDLNTVLTGLLAALSVYLLRILFFIMANGTFYEAAYAYFPELFFYSFYSIFFALLTNKNSIYNNINTLFIKLIFCDFGANFIEILIRSKCDIFHKQIFITLIIVAFLRSSIIWLMLNGIKYYKMFLLKEEHENRYKKLLWMTSKLKTEMYWMRKNMDNIEKVMSDTYDLYEKISSNKDIKLLSSKALNIAKDIHEIKKEYKLVLRGIDEIIENKLHDEGMYFSEIVSILKESFINDLNHRNLNIKLNFKIETDFFTDKHYYLMSIFRNLLSNSIDSLIETNSINKISFIHKQYDDKNIFIIQDTGCGIEKENLKYIFQPGYSTKINYTTGDINRGLGLSIVKDIVEKNLNGEIKITSKINEGTTFKIIIPKKELEVKK
ncbi:sensor histidine kinase GlnK [Clostridium tepidiprofundi DSM 19306]|uniref:histidine kinase n=1 Tax=Clostridium tepidiprofundi DSM 19306 TaxID=1121338 RepID=A0A151B219_9CLOT|nr:ATP-binding protein [Clostridium tepidiprofundi]KYH33954.1 sensor histidine kinase GlnK [Clostridium tepidiprofundi DSM 19306]